MSSIIQITDSHISLKKPVNSERLKQVVEHINQLKKQPKLVIHTGDVVDDFAIEAYIEAKNILDQLHAPYYLTCGNHDKYSNLKQVFTQHQYFCNSEFSYYSMPMDFAKIIVLDTSVDNKVYGHLGGSQLAWLANELQCDEDIYIFMHHFAHKVNDVFFDKISLRNAQEFLSLIANFENIKAVFSGHYHLANFSQINGVPFLTCPSTAYAHDICPDLSAKLLLTNPSFLIHHLFKDAPHSSQVVNCCPIEDQGVLNISF